MKSIIRQILILTLVGLGFASCKPRIIPENDMVVILTEVFITDATVTSPNLSLKYSRRDSIEYYKPIYEKLGYTETQFLASVDYYTENPQVLDKLLDRVISLLSQRETEIETQINREREAFLDSTNLWKGPKSIVLPLDGKQDSIPFKIPVTGLGTYKLTANINFLANDSTLQPSAQAWFSRDTAGGVLDSIKVKHKLEIVEFNKSASPIKLDLSIELSDSLYTHFEGLIVAHKPQEGEWEKHVEVSSIHISYTPSLKLKEKLLIREKLDTLGKRTKLIRPDAIKKVER